MKAKDFNGSISTWRRLPKTYKSATKYYTAFDKASKDIIEAEGFYDVVKPSYDSISQKLGSIEFDSEKKVFTYPVIDIDFDATYEVIGEDMEPTGETLPVYDIDKLKSDIKTQIKAKAGELLKPTDWYVTRLAERAIVIPDSIKTERADVITKSDSFELEVAALATVEEVLRYTFNFNPQPDPII
jgi:hypothetical protein